jgi:hypothetical protein
MLKELLCIHYEEMKSLSQSHSNAIQASIVANKKFNLMPRGRLGNNQTIRDRAANKVKSQEIRMLRIERDKNTQDEEQQYCRHLTEVYINKILRNDEFSIHTTKILSVSTLTCKEKVKLIEETGRIIESNEQSMRFRDTESIKQLPYIPGYVE